MDKMDKAGDVAKAQPTPTSSVGWKDYYPSIDQLVDADPEGLKKLTGKLSKDKDLMSSPLHLSS